MSREKIAVKTPVGMFTMELVSDVVVRSYFSHDIDQENDSHPYAQAVRRYFAGDMTALRDIPYAQDCSEFYKDVYKEMAAIPPGKTRSYKEIAEATGRAKASRAVGTACRRNHIPLIVPCHRVVKSDGSMGNYAFGTAIKRYLLDHEGVIN